LSWDPRINDYVRNWEGDVTFLAAIDGCRCGAPVSPSAL
jgi:hypothetical protein